MAATKPLENLQIMIAEYQGLVDALKAMEEGKPSSDWGPTVKLFVVNDMLPGFWPVSTIQCWECKTWTLDLEPHSSHSMNLCGKCTAARNKPRRYVVKVK